MYIDTRRTVRKETNIKEKSIAYSGGHLTLLPKRIGGEKGWAVTGFLLDHPGTLSLPETYEGLPVLALEEKEYQGSYPQVEKLALGKNLCEISLHDGCFPSLREISLIEESPFRATGGELYSREGRLLYRLGAYQEAAAQEQKPLKEPLRATEGLLIRKGTLLSVPFPVDTLVLPGEVKSIGGGAFSHHAPRVLCALHLPGWEEEGLGEHPGAERVEELFLWDLKKPLTWEELCCWPALQGIHLPEGRKGQVSLEGILYSDEGKTLSYFPPCHPAGGTLFQVPKGVEKIGERAFACSQVKRVQMGNEVREVGKNAFLGCKELTDVWLSDSIEELPGSGLHARYIYTSGVFGGCRALSHVHLPKGLKRLGASAFFQSGLSKVQLPEGLEEIGARAFYQTPLKEVILPDSVRMVGREAFFGEVSLLQAREGTARGLFHSAFSAKGQVVRVRVLFQDRSKPSVALPLPVDERGEMEELLSLSWDGEAFDWESMARCIPLVRDADLRMELSFLATLSLDGRSASPYRKYLSGKAFPLGRLLIEQGEAELFPYYLKRLSPSRRVLEELLELCNREGKTAFLPLLLEENKGNGQGGSWNL